jgi:ubiquinone/menaquinone biosynthesis C-methylase UbiE
VIRHRANRRCLGFYERRVFPWLNDKLGGSAELRRIRVEALTAARGHVIEIGFGSGPNLALYPEGVQCVVAVEPNDGMVDRAAPAIHRSRIPIGIVIAEAERLPLPESIFDTAVSTLTLCSVSNPVAALSELHRVLRQNGRLLILEHGLSDDPGVARWQHRLNPLQKIVACGCHLDRPITDIVEQQGFRFDTLRRFYLPNAPRTHGWISFGNAVKR